jgi:membrane-associated phospholipid phosphatase
MKPRRRNGFWLGFVCAAFILIAGCANPVRNKTADTPPLNLAEVSNGTNQTENPSKKPLWLESAKADLVRFPDRFLEDSKDTLLRIDNITALLLAGGASVAMHNTNADKNLAEHFSRHHIFHNFADESLFLIGDPPTHFAAAGLWYAISAENQDEINKQRALTMITALSVTGVVTTGLKAIRDNETPNGQYWAWPSGHTSSSFTVASVLDEFYGPKVGIPAYVLASVVAYRMMDTGDHWGSDVVFGATLGWVVGHTIAGKHKKLEVAGFELLPYMPTANDPAAGICLVKQF